MLSARGWLAALWVTAALLGAARPAHAVVPGLQGPLQAFLQVLPQVAPFALAGLAGLFSVPAWRPRLARGFRGLATPRGAGAAVLSLGALALSVSLLRGGDRSRTASAAAAAAAAPPPSSSGAAADWPTFRANPARTGATPGGRGPGVTTPRVAWSFRDQQIQLADWSSSPAVVGGRVYVGSAQASVFDSSGMVYCLDARTGKRVWQFQTPKQIFSSPSVVGGRVYVGEGLHVDAGCKFYCLDARTGKKLWATATKGHTESSPAVVGGRLYAGAGSDGVYCLDAQTGKVIWHVGGGGAAHVDVSPLVATGRVFVGTGYGRLRAMALDAKTGKTVWESPSDLPVWGDPAPSGANVLLGVGNGDFGKSHPTNPRGGVWCVRAATGKTVWRRDLPDAVLTAATVRGARAFVGCRDGKVYALDTATGAVVWSSAAVGGPVVASLALDDAALYAAGGAGRVVALAPGDGRTLWTLDLAPQTAPDVNLWSSPAAADGRLFLGTSKEKFLCLGR
jgi:outer membrane protein assembly factor BamB